MLLRNTLANTLASGVLLVLFLRLLELRNNEAAFSHFGTIFGDAPILTSHDTRLPDTNISHASSFLNHEHQTASAVNLTFPGDLLPSAVELTTHGGTTSRSTSGIESKATCNDENCLLENVCVDRGTEKKHPIMIRLFGNESHVNAVFGYLKGNKSIGYRESTVLWGNMTAPGIRAPPTIDSNSTATTSHRSISNNCGHDLGNCAVATFRVM